MITHLCFLLATLTAPPQEESFPLFLPPSGWQCAPLKTKSAYVQVGFVGKGSTQFNPSINLAVEDTDVSLKEYLKAVKEIVLSKPEKKWRDLGKFQMKAGVGRLTEITAPSKTGDVKMLQAILVEGKKAYILTAAVLKEDYPKMQEELLSSLQSLSLEKDLFTPIQDETQRSRLAALFDHLSAPDSPAQQEAVWVDLQKAITEEYSEMGGHWQFLTLKEGYSKIHR